jgi:hypothetical protein
MKYYLCFASDYVLLFSLGETKTEMLEKVLVWSRNVCGELTCGTSKGGMLALGDETCLCTPMGCMKK